ncbi:MAG: glycosyltransferase [Candidatus Diapherotrites archaeon]
MFCREKKGGRRLKASVIVPAFNAEKTIGQCLESLLQQSFGRKEFEVLVVDDGSTDGTAEKVKKFGKEVKLIAQENRGPAAARNNGARNAKGEVLVFIDSDCVAEKNWLQEMVAPIDEAEKIVGVQGTYRTRQNEWVARFAQLEIGQRHEKMAEEKEIDFMGSYSAAFLKKVFLAVNGFDETFPIASGEDTDLSFRISSRGYRFYFNKNAVVWHLHPSSLLKFLRIKFFRGYWRVWVYGKNRGKILHDSYSSRALKLQMALVPLVALSAVFAPFSGAEVALAGVALSAVLAVSIIPLTFFMLSRDFFVGIASPIVILMRAAVIDAGVCYGLVKKLFAGNGGK